MSNLEKRSCVVCAWRENCQKRFTSSPDIALRCPEYARDVTLKETAGKERTSEEEKEES
ncbi:MAG: hypothetical protein JSU92_01430 [Deltaproteobacteria bacterium]|nr:MAG: hypothetical protein JSU92_01430 [Deltaproteobacteria bacterium]